LEHLAPKGESKRPPSVGQIWIVHSLIAKTNLIHVDATVTGKIPLGWIMPLLAGFKANVDWNKPKKGSFRWIVPIDELLSKCIDRLVLGIKEIHERENSRPECLGRNAIAWRMSYSTVSQAILESTFAEFFPTNLTSTLITQSSVSRARAKRSV
jgi:hypothetical protein